METSTQKHSNANMGQDKSIYAYGHWGHSLLNERKTNN